MRPQYERASNRSLTSPMGPRKKGEGRSGEKTGREEERIGEEGAIVHRLRSPSARSMAPSAALSLLLDRKQHAALAIESMSLCI